MLLLRTRRRSCRGDAAPTRSAARRRCAL